MQILIVRLEVGEKAAALPQLLADVHRIAERLIPGDHDDHPGEDDQKVVKIVKIEDANT